jgi:hypothetical protein
VDRQVLLLGNVVRILMVDRLQLVLTSNPSLQIVNESLPIFLNDVLGGGVAAVVVSTVCFNPMLLET